MICRKCGAEIPDNSIRCSNCGIKVNMYCPKCHTLNTFGRRTCVNCETDLILYCKVCGSANMYNQKECRKCHSSLSQTEKQEQKKDIQVVESFSSDESVYTNIEQKEQIRIVPNTNENGIPVIETVSSDYQEPEIKDIFNNEDINLEANETSDETKDSVQTNNFYNEEIKNNIDDIQLLTEENEADSLGLEKPIDNEEIESSNDVNTENTEDITVKKETVLKITNVIKNSLKKHIIALRGAEGSGKSAILKQVSKILINKGYLSLYGSCTQLIRVTSYGFLQDVFLRLMGFPPYTTSTTSFVKEFQKSNFAESFSFLKGNELNLFLNMLYPAQKDVFDNIIANKAKVFSILEKIMKSFLTENNLIILIDNFELLDEASSEFLIHMIKKGYFNGRLKLLVAYSGKKDIKDCLDLSIDEEKIVETIDLEKLSKQELFEFIERNFYINLDELPNKETVNELLLRANGDAMKLEQEIALLFDVGYLQIEKDNITINEELNPIKNYSTFEELIKLRINALSPSAKNVLFMAAIIGYRFATDVLCLSVTMSEENAKSALKSLLDNFFVCMVDNYTCEFKNLTLWDLIYKEAKSDLLYEDNAKRLYFSLKPLILSSSLQIQMSCGKILSNNEEFLIWQNTANIAAKLGDTGLYIFAAKQCLGLVDNQNILNVSETKQRIYEEIGKLLYEKSPKEAVINLSNVLDYSIKEVDPCKMIDVSSYFIKSCYLIGNYFGVIEAVDAILDTLRNMAISPLVIALIKTRKLNALLNIGNSEQVVNIVKEEVLPELNKALTQEQCEEEYKNIALNAFLNSHLILAKAYAMQGHNGVSEILETIKELIGKYDCNVSHYKLYASIISAFSKTITGDINASNEILNNISLAYKNQIMEPELLTLWNLINIINRILLNKYENVVDDLFELTVYSNNINDHFVKNISKLLLGYIKNKDGNSEIAEEIYQEQVLYFAKEKIAIGALLAWALIIRKNIDEGKLDTALEIANKSLEIAQDSKINNYCFIICFQEQLAQIYMKKHDFDSTKMYLEKSIVIAKQFNLKYQLIGLYINYAHYIEELMKDKRIYSKENVELVHETYKNAISLSKELVLQNMIDFTTKEYSGFKTYCQLNSIEV